MGYIKEYVYRSPVKSSKSNTKIAVATFFGGIHVTTYQPVSVAYLNSPSTSLCIIIDIVNLSYVMVNRHKNVAKQDTSILQS